MDAEVVDYNILYKVSYKWLVLSDGINSISNVDVTPSFRTIVTIGTYRFGNTIDYKY